jgi:hypothetical protein
MANVDKNEVMIRTMFEQSDPAVMLEFAEQILVTAVEGGIDYWAQIHKIEEKDGRYDLVVISDREGEGNSENPMRYGLFPSRIIGGFVDLAAKTENADKMSRNNYERLVRQFKIAMLEKDPENLDCNFDAEDGDCFVQWLIFDKIVYG